MQLQFVALIAVISLVAVQGGLFEFIMDNEEIFEKCPEYPETLGIHEAFDLSDMKFVYKDGNVRVFGNSTCLWEGVQPTDRIAVRGDLYKFQRGDWQPTMLSASRRDYCKILFDKNSLTYQAWSSHIREEDRKCFNNYGHTYHHTPYDVNTVMQLAGNMDGRHKIVGRVSAYDENNVKREKSICFQVLGDFIKLN